MYNFYDEDHDSDECNDEEYCRKFFFKKYKMNEIDNIEDELTSDNSFTLDDFSDEEFLKASEKAKNIISMVNVNNNLKHSYLQGNGLYDRALPYIYTYSGNIVNPTNIALPNILIQDIAHALSNICRFTGHTKDFYSVAQHSVIVSYLCHPDDALSGLLHDASEAYLTDIAAPLKNTDMFKEYREIEKNLMDRIRCRFNLPKEQPESVSKADKDLLHIEVGSFINNRSKALNDVPVKTGLCIAPLSSEDAEILFAKRFFELIGRPEDFKLYPVRK